MRGMTMVISLPAACSSHGRSHGNFSSIADLKKAARTALEAQAWDTADSQAVRIKGVAGEFRWGVWTHLIGNSVITFLAGLLVSAVSYRLTAH